MTNDNSNDWSNQNAAGGGDPKNFGGQQPGGGGNFDSNSSLFDRGFKTIRTLVDRSFNGGVLLAYLALFGIWMLGAGVFVGALVAAVFALGLVGSSSPDVAAPVLIGVIGGGYLIALLAIIAWQTIMIGLQRPMYELMFRGPDVFTGVGAVLKESASRFFPILGVNTMIGVVIYGGGLLGASGVILPSVLGVVSWEPGTLLLAGYFLVWGVSAIIIGFFFAPATYFVATRSLGIFGALSKSFGFVKSNLKEMLVAWVIFIAVALVFGCANAVVSLVPCLGSIVQLAFSILGGFAGLCYWAGIYMMLEDEFDPTRGIAW